MEAGEGVGPGGEGSDVARSRGLDGGADVHDPELDRGDDADAVRDTTTSAAQSGERRAGLGGAFRNVVTANLSSSLGDGIARVAAPLLAVRLTDDPLLISGVAAVAMLPWLFFAIPAGIVLDRVDRRHALAAANGVRTLLAAALVVLVATGTLTIWWLYVIVFLYGVFETVYDGAIRAVVPALVGRADLPRANSRIEAGENIVQNFLSAPLTSTLFAVAVAVPLAIGSGAYAVAAVLAFLLPAVAAGDHRSAPSSATPWYRQFADGYRFIVGNSVLRPLWFLSVFVGLCVSAATATFVLFVVDRLGLPEAWYGGLMLAGAIGGLGGAIVAGRLKRRFGTGRVMAAANLAACVLLMVVGAFPAVPVTAIGFALFSGAVIVWNVLVMSLRQCIPPSGLLGRVHGTWRTLLWGTMPLGSLLGGLLARIDLTTPMVAAGGAATVAALLGYRFLSGLPNPEDVVTGETVGEVAK